MQEGKVTGIEVTETNRQQLAEHRNAALGEPALSVKPATVKPEEAALQDQGFIQQLADMMPGLLYLFDTVEQRNIYINPRSSDLLGYSPETVLAMGSEFADRVMHPDDLAGMAAHFERLNAAPEGSFFDIEYRMRHVNGEWRWFNSRDTVFSRTAAGQLRQILGTAQDITNRKQEEQRKAVQYAVTRVLAEATAFVDAVPAILQSLCENLGWQVGVIWSVDAHDSVLRYVNSWQAPTHNLQRFIEVNQQVTFAPGVGAPGQIWLTHQPLWIADLGAATHFPRAASAAQEGLHALFGFPILLGNEILGVIECFSDRVQQPDEDLLQMMAAIGSQIGQFMERKRTEAALRESQELFQGFMNHSPIAAFIKDEAGRYIYVNSFVEKLLGREQTELIGKTDFELLPVEIAQQIHVNDVAVLTTGQPTQVLETIPFEDKEHHYMSFKFLQNVSGRHLLAGVAIDISDRKQAEEALRASENRLRAIFETEPECVKLVAQDGTLLDMNAAGLEMIEVASAEAAIGRSVYSLIAPEHQEAFEALNQRVCRGEKATLEFEIIGCRGTRRWMETHAVPLPQAADNTFVQLAITRDITQRKQAEAERERLLSLEQAARADAEAANRIKDEFLAVLSHELRTPLNPILGWTKLLRTRKFDQQATDRALETIERNAKLQTQLIEDLLDVSRILQGKMVLNVAPVNLISTITAALETVHLAAEAKGIQIQTIFNPHVGPVLGDAGRLQQVIWNILSNAIKFTPAGGRVEVRLERVGTQVEIQVKDTGKGIAPKFLPHVFEYFRQEDGTTTRKFGGLGLGLAIVRHLTELQGGTVQAESPGEGLGATFTVSLPLAAIAPQTTQAQESLMETLDLSQLQILVVDDEPDMQELMLTILELYGAKVSTVASATEALALLDQLKPDILISDIGMPDMDGYMLIQQVRRLPPEQGGQIPAIALTAYVGEINQRQALKAGFQLHISKPVAPEALVEAIASLIGANPQQRVLR